MFQGLGTNQKQWNEHTESRFLDRLKKLGSVYTYQDKINNIWHYNKSSTDPTTLCSDYDDDIDIDLSYVKCNTHIKLVYDNLIKKYKNIDNYDLIPIGFSLGGYMALYFAQHYKTTQPNNPTLFKNVIMLDSSGFNPKNIKNQLKDYEKLEYIKTLTNATYKQMLQRLKTMPDTTTILHQLNQIHIYIRLLSASKYLNLVFQIPTTLFVNIQTSGNSNSNSDNSNEIKLEEIELYKKHNPDTFNAFFFTNQTHYIYSKLKPAKYIIDYIKNMMDGL
jgi:hypothetical protein